VVSTDPAGVNVITPTFQAGGQAVEYTLNPGVYYIHAGSLPGGESVQYALHISMQGSPERPTPLTIGSAPAIRLHVASSVPPPAPGPTPPLAPPPSPPSPPPLVTRLNFPPTRPSGDVPSDILLALGVGPLGGVVPVGEGGTVAPGLLVLDRVLSQSPPLLRSDDLAALVSLLFTVDHTGGEEKPDEAAKEVVADDFHGAFPLFAPDAAVGILVQCPEWLLPPVPELPEMANDDSDDSDGNDLVGEVEETAMETLDAEGMSLALCCVFAGVNLEAEEKHEPALRRQQRG
jgi:hypothetical protein